MKLNSIMILALVASMLTLYAHADVGHDPVETLAATTTRDVMDDPERAGALFLDWESEKGSDGFQIFHPWGNNGTRIILSADGVVVATTTVVARTPFAQIAHLQVVPLQDGTHTFTAQLCVAEATTSGCLTSNSVALHTRSGRSMLEADLPADEQTVERADELRQMHINDMVAYMKAAEGRMHGLVPQDEETLRSIGKGMESNVERVRRIMSSDARRMLLSPTNNIARADLYDAIARFPAFCNESDGGESLDVACARELSALIAYVTYYTSGREVGVSTGMRNPTGISMLIGSDSKRFGNIFASKEGDLVLRIKEHPSDALLATLWWYMTPQSPEPDPHSALLGLWRQNAEDIRRRVEPGFGATLNIASHGNACASEAGALMSLQLRTLYRGYLKAFQVSDDRADSCAGQSAFGLGGSAFIPQYWSYESGAGTCHLSYIENEYFVQDSKSLQRCMRDAKSPKSDGSLSLDEEYQYAAKKVDALIERVGYGGLPTSATSTLPDKRTTLGTSIIGTYPLWRALERTSQPYLIPYEKINTLFLMGAYPGKDGVLLFDEVGKYEDEIYAGDCFRDTCPHGLLHQLNLAHELYPDIKMVLSIGGWDGSTNFKKLSDKEAREKFISSVREFLLAHPLFSGIDITWMYPSNEPGNDLINPGGDKETMRRMIIDLRAMANDLYEEDGHLRKLYLGVGASTDAIAAVGLRDIAPAVDSIHLITYDLHGPWDERVGHNAQLFATNIGSDTLSVANAVVGLRAAGVPAKKIIIGIPFYGRMWSGVRPGNNALLPGLDTKVGTTTNAKLIDYRTITAGLLGKGAFQYYEDALRSAAYLYDGDRFVSYDAPDIIEKKMQYVWQDGFGGVLLADVMGDDGTLSDRVLNVIAEQSEKKSCVLTRKPERNLAANSRGADVFALQTFLACLGVLPAYVDINGNYGATTEAGVLRFQKNEGLLETGVVGTETRERLLHYLSAASSTSALR